MSESAKNAITNKTANDTDDSKIRLYELAMSCTESMELCLLMCHYDDAQKSQHHGANGYDDTGKWCL
jgi:hypothetical protein